MRSRLRRHTRLRQGLHPFFAQPFANLVALRGEVICGWELGVHGRHNTPHARACQHLIGYQIEDVYTTDRS
jgi:hypothetical protein